MSDSLKTELNASRDSVTVLADSLAAAAATEAELSAEIARLRLVIHGLDGEVERLDVLWREARAAELDRLDTAPGRRDPEFFELRRYRAALDAIKREIRDRNRIAEEVRRGLGSLIEEGRVEMATAHGRLVIRFREDDLFDESGSDALRPEGQSGLARVGSVLAAIGDRRFQVEGHTPDALATRASAPSNWALSISRALAVVQYLVDTGMDPGRLSAAGFDGFQPLGPRDDPEGRYARGRIDIVMLPNLDLIAAAQDP